MFRKSKIDLAWAAGFLDGEGHFQATKNQFVKRKNGEIGAKSYSYFKITAVQSHVAVLNRLKRILGGTISGPYHYPPSKPYHSYQVCTNTEEAFKKLLPYLSSVKRAQGQKALLKVETQNRLGRKKYEHTR